MRIILVSIAILSFLSSCVTYEACKQKYGQTSDTVFVLRDTTILIHDTVFVPGDSLFGDVNFDSTHVSSSGNLSANFQKQDSGRIKYLIRYKPNYIYTNKYYNITRKIKATVTVWKTPVKKPWYRGFSNWQWLLLIIGVGVLGYLIRALGTLFKKN
jgi:hypothetical protein